MSDTIKPIETSENTEAGIVLVSTIGAVASGYIAALPLAPEIKLPTLTLSAGITAAVLAFWKSKVNKAK